MGGLFGGGGNTTVGTRYNGMGLQSSQQGLPIPIIYGTVKMSANLIWYGDFTSHEHKEGGKGGGPTVTSYTYSTAVAMGIGEGGINGFGAVWLADGKTSLGGLNIDAFLGAEGQMAWSYLTTHHPDQALNYPYTAYVASSSFDLGQSNVLPQMWFETYGILNGTGVIANSADAALVIQDFMTNTRYGCHFPYLDTTSLLTAPNSYANYCGVNGISFAVSISESKQARQYISEWLEATNTAAVWSGESLKFIPFGDAPMTGYGYTFTPDLTIRAELEDDDFHFDKGESPVKISRADPFDCYNNVKVQVRDSNNEYNPAICEVKDQASIEQIGLRTRSQINAEFIPSPTAGMMSAELIKNRDLYVRNQYRFRLSWEHGRLEPMDLVTLTRIDQGLTQKVVRVMEITEDETGLLEFVAEEFIEGSQWSVQYPAQGCSGYVGNSQVAPGNTNTPFIFEPTAAIIGTANPQVWIAASGPAATWGGARVWISTDGGSSYHLAGSIRAGGITGTLTANLASNGTTLSVNLTECCGTLSSVSAGDAALGRTAMIIGSEVLAYTTATLTAPNTYNLTGLVRGMYGTTAAAHSTSDRIGYLGGPVFKFEIPNASYYGTAVHIKLTSFNIYGAAEQGMDTATDYTYTVTGNGATQTIYIQASESGKPTAGAIINTYIAPKAMVLPTNLSGTTYTVGTNPTSTAVFIMKKNGVQFCTASVATNGVITFTGASTTFAAGDVFTVLAPSPQDAILANVAFLFKATTAA
ncbi:MAG: hypothetical protein HGB04_04030 [Chlorobiaceae bacterium]|nr:hypothetical protein [Chlorobiaceae bacterium]